MAKFTMEEIKYGPISESKYTYAKDIIELMGLLGYNVDTLDYTISKTNKDGMEHVTDKCYAIFKGTKVFNTPISNKLLKEFQESNMINLDSAVFEKQNFVGLDLFLNSAMSREFALTNVVYPLLQEKKVEHKSSKLALSALEDLERNLFAVDYNVLDARVSKLDMSVQNFMTRVLSMSEEKLNTDSKLYCVDKAILESDKVYLEKNKKTKDMFENSNKEDINFYYNNEYSTLTELEIDKAINADYKQAVIHAAKNIESNMAKK